MARSEARLAVSIWTDADFLARTAGAQRLFMFLLSQPDLAHDGVLALRERRWSKSAAGLTVADIARDLDELHRARFVVIDEDAEELLIRSFIRRDKVYRQPNVLRAAQDHLETVTSPVILAAVAAELRRVAAAEDIGEAAAAIIAEMLKGLPNPSPNPFGGGAEVPAEGPSTDPSDIDDHSEIVPPFEMEREADETAHHQTQAGVSAGDKGSGNPSGNPTPGTPGERGVVTAVSSASPFPVPRSPDPVPRQHASRAAPREARGTRLPDDFAVTDDMKTWFATHCPNVDGPAETAKFRDYWRAQPGAKGRKTDWPATWRNWMRKAAEDSTGRRPASPAMTGANRYRSDRNDNPFANGANAIVASQHTGAPA